MFPFRPTETSSSFLTLRRPCMEAMAITAGQKCAKWQEPRSVRARLKNRLPNGGNLPILGI